MQNIFSITTVCISLFMALLIGILAFFRNNSLKKNYFLLMQTAIIFYLFGYLLELTSQNAEEAYTAVKVLYTGALFIPVFGFFFITDYCSFRIHPVLFKVPMCMLALASAILMWTTKYHGFVFTNYWHSPESFNHLNFTPGPLYYLINIYPAVYILLAIGILIWKIRSWKNKYRKQLLILLFCVAIPFLVEGFFKITVSAGIARSIVYFTPYTLMFMSICFYIGVVRFNIFEIISIATFNAMEDIREGFIIVDSESNYLSSNQTAENIFPQLSKHLKGDSIFSIENWPAELKTIESGSVEFFITNPTRHFKANISPVFGNNKMVVAMIILLSEITDSVKLMKELESAAYIDSLTGIYNRKHFTELAKVEIERALRQNQAVYLGMLDLDHFKNVNDTYGHAAGDTVLRETASIVRQTIRSYDLIGRYGGEEFILLITNLDGKGAKKLVERIRENIGHSITFHENIEIKVTCSIGLSSYLDDDSLESSAKKADAALYAAKRAGRNQVMFYDELVQGDSA